MAMVPAPTVTFSVRPPAIRPCAAGAAAPGGGRVRAEGSGGGKWWAPLLGWSGKPDYIDASPAAPVVEEEEERGRRFRGLTEEKARELRVRMMETASFHDAMYHSAIASRLASASDARRSG